MIDSAGLKKQEAAKDIMAEVENICFSQLDWKHDGKNMKNARCKYVFVHSIYYYQTWSHMAWLAPLWKQKLSIVTIFQETYW